VRCSWRCTSVDGKKRMNDPGLMRSARGATRRSRRSIIKSLIASTFCFLPALYCLGVASFGIRNFSQYGTQWPQFLRYIGVPLMLAAIMTAVGLKGSRAVRVNIGGAACVLLVVLFVYEAYLESRYLDAVEDLVSEPPGLAAVSAGAFPPGRTLKKLNNEIGSATLAEAALSALPYSIVNLCRTGRQRLSYRADRYGFRNPDALYSRPIDRMLIGDSFVEGICLPGGADLLSRLRERHGPTVGIGSRGAGPLMELAMLGRFGPVVRPRWVVFAFYEGNDWDDLRREPRLRWLGTAVEPGVDFGPATMPEGLARRAQAVIDRWDAQGLPAAVGLFRKAHVWRNFLALHQTWTQLGLGYPKAASRLPLYGQVLARGQAVADRWGGRVALVYIPQTSRLTGLLPDAFVYDQVRDQVLDAARANNIPVIDLTREMEGMRDKAGLYASDGHLSARGAEWTAATVDRALAEFDRLGGHP
jgi:hypothetical protein